MKLTLVQVLFFWGLFASVDLSCSQNLEVQHGFERHEGFHVVEGSTGTLRRSASACHQSRKRNPSLLSSSLSSSALSEAISSRADRDFGSRSSALSHPNRTHVRNLQPLSNSVQRTFMEVFVDGDRQPSPIQHRQKNGLRPPLSRIRPLRSIDVTEPIPIPKKQQLEGMRDRGNEQQPFDNIVPVSTLSDTKPKAWQLNGKNADVPWLPEELQLLENSPEQPAESSPAQDEASLAAEHKKKMYRLLDSLPQEVAERIGMYTGSVASSQAVQQWLNSFGSGNSDFVDSSGKHSDFLLAKFARKTKHALQASAPWPLNGDNFYSFLQTKSRRHLPIAYGALSCASRRMQQDLDTPLVFQVLPRGSDPTAGSYLIIFDVALPVAAGNVSDDAIHIMQVSFSRSLTINVGLLECGDLLVEFDGSASMRVKSPLLNAIAGHQFLQRSATIVVELPKVIGANQDGHSQMNIWLAERVMDLSLELKFKQLLYSKAIPSTADFTSVKATLGNKLVVKLAKSNFQSSYLSLRESAHSAIVSNMLLADTLEPLHLQLKVDYTSLLKLVSRSVYTHVEDSDGKPSPYHINLGRIPVFRRKSKMKNAWKSLSMFKWVKVDESPVSADDVEELLDSLAHINGNVDIPVNFPKFILLASSNAQQFARCVNEEIITGEKLALKLAQLEADKSENGKNSAQKHARTHLRPAVNPSEFLVFPEVYLTA